jgi:hypothetical protein
MKELEKQLLDLEDTVFRSGKYHACCHKRAVQYRLDIWESKLKSLPLLVKLIHHKEINEIKVRILALRNI